MSTSWGWLFKTVIIIEQQHCISMFNKTYRKLFGPVRAQDMLSSTKHKMGIIFNAPLTCLRLSLVIFVCYDMLSKNLVLSFYNIESWQPFFTYNNVTFILMEDIVDWFYCFMRINLFLVIALKCFKQVSHNKTKRCPLRDSNLWSPVTVSIQHKNFYSFHLSYPLHYWG